MASISIPLVNNTNREVQQQTQLSSNDICQLRSIYVTSFPASQQIEFGLLLASIQRGTRAVYTIKTDSTLVGFAITLSLTHTDVCFLEYLAVSGESRDQGLGTILLQSVLDHLRQSGHISRIILEVESEMHGTEMEKAQRLRRIRFYERNGARFVECAPNYRSPDGMWQHGMPMRLMWIPLSPSPTAITGELLGTCIIGIFTQSYNLLPEDPLLKEVLEEIVC